jgi:hypothetical protein
VPQGVLDADQRRIRIEHLGGHGVTQLVAAGSHLGLADILLHALLDTAHRQRPAAAGPFLNHKDALGSNRTPDAQIPAECLLRIVADVDDPVLAAFATFNPDAAVPLPC